MADKVYLTVFDTKETKTRLRKLIVGLEKPVTYAPGLGVRDLSKPWHDSRLPKIPGLYSLDRHRGEISDVSGLVRVVKSQIWANEFACEVKAALEENRIGYTSGEVEMGRRTSISRNARAVNVFRLVETYTVTFD